MDAEAALLERLYEGDEKGLAKLYGRLSGNVHAPALQMLQDTFVKLHRNPHGFEPGRGSVRAFVNTAARNACLS